METEVPILWDKKENCCGCSACFAVCPVNAIVMERDEEGFEYPHIYADRCVRCHACVSVCAFRRNQKEKGILQ